MELNLDKIENYNFGSKGNLDHFVKFIYSEKGKIFVLCTASQIIVEISQNFVAFSEYMNFNRFFFEQNVICVFFYHLVTKVIV